MKTYAGTNLLVRICYGCGKEVTDLSDLWVDYDDNCCVCTKCRNGVRGDYVNELAWQLSIVPAAKFIDDPGIVNELEEG